MKKLIVIFSLFLSVNAFAQKADSAKKDTRINIQSSSTHASPLVMVDGVKYKGSINTIPPDDIQSVELLKDASAKKMYGDEAKNGVIFITTKKAKATSIKPGRAVIVTADSASAPLYIIDGKNATAQTFKSINPDDIDNISVVKDASANSIYGPAGKNGVVVVVTKTYKIQQQNKKVEAEKQGKNN